MYGRVVCCKEIYWCEYSNCVLCLLISEYFKISISFFSSLGIACGVMKWKYLVLNEFFICIWIELLGKVIECLVLLGMILDKILKIILIIVFLLKK